MTAEDQFEGSGGDPYCAPAPIPALTRFVVAALWTAGVFWACGYVYTLFPGRNLIPDLLFRRLRAC